MSTPPFSWPRQLRLIRKESAEILRDRRTILTLVAMPLLLYPILSISFQQYFMAHRPTMVYRLGFPSEQERDEFFEDIAEGQKALEKKNPKAVPTFQSSIVEDLKEAVKTGQIDLGLGRGKEAGDIELVYLPASAPAQNILQFLERSLAARNAALLERIFKTRRAVLRFDRQPLADNGRAAGIVSLSALVPLVLILMTITGAVYPAIDLTAGERERGTLEILIAAPVPRFWLLLAKYAAVLTVALMTALVNLVAMTLTVSLGGLGGLVWGDQGFSILLILQLFGLLLLFSAFFSAVLLCLTSFARSFKEAQAYLIPLMLVSMAPGLLAMLPGLELTPRLAVVPLLNIVLLARDLFEKGPDPLSAWIVIGSTLFYAIAVIRLASQIFGAEDVLYNDAGSWKDWLHRPRMASESVPLSTALWCLLIVVPGHYLGQGLMRWVGPFPLWGTLASIAIMSWTWFVLVPTIALYWGRHSWRQAMAWMPTGWRGLGAGLMLGLSTWPWVLWILSLVMPAWAEGLQEQMAEHIRGWREAGQTSLLGLAGALMLGGAAEELFFRGFLFGAWRKHAPAFWVIVGTATLFGLSHALLGGALGMQQLVPATLLGALLGTVRHLTGSVIPGVIMHMAHNGCLTWFGQYLGSTGKEEVPVALLAGAAVGLAAGLALLWSRRSPLAA